MVAAATAVVTRTGVHAHSPPGRFGTGAKGESWMTRSGRPTVRPSSPSANVSASALQPIAGAHVGMLAAAAVATAGLTLPPAVLPGWLVLATLGLLLAAIDAATTWLPLSLTRVAWATMVLATGIGAILGG